MSNETNRKSTHRAYVVSGEGDNANWLEIGAASDNRDGKGYSIAFSAIPVTGNFVIREIKERPAKKAAD